MMIRRKAEGGKRAGESARDRSAEGPLSVFRFPLSFPAAVLIGCVRIYQKTLSPLVGRSCRFHPTCSNYFIEAVKKYGAVRGGWRGVRRILRCHPFHPGGYDPP